MENQTTADTQATNPLVWATNPTTQEVLFQVTFDNRVVYRGETLVTIEGIYNTLKQFVK